MRSNKNGKGGWGGSGQSGAAGWDQFAANKSKFNVDTTFDENIYTTAIDKNAVGISEAEADRIAREIMSQGSTNVHVQEERGLRVTADYDEEDRYGAVIGTGAAAGGAHSAKPAVPKAPAWGGSGAGVTANHREGGAAPQAPLAAAAAKGEGYRREEARHRGRREAQERAEPQRQGVHAERQGCGVQAVVPDEETRGAGGARDPPAGAYPIGMPGMMPGMMPQYPMGMPGMPPNMMPHMPAYGAPQYRGAPPQHFRAAGAAAAGGGQQMGGFSPAAAGGDCRRRRSRGARRRERGGSPASRGPRASARRVRVKSRRRRGDDEKT